jgi:hypothetical protein
MVDGNYLRRIPSGNYVSEPMSLHFFLERVAIDFQFSRDGNFILNLQGTVLLGLFIPHSSNLHDVIATLEDDYGFKIQV